MPRDVRQVDTWRSRPEPWHGPAARERPLPRVERNETGGTSLVAERVPFAANNMDVLNEYFGTFGPIVALQINHHRHEAVISFARAEDAEESLRMPVLNDPSIGLRPWRSKGRAPHEVPETAPVSAITITPPGVPAVPERTGNVVLESGRLLQKKRQRDEIEDRRKVLLQGLTDQLKLVMARISDPETPERKREQFQVILASVKEKLTALTPQEHEKARPRRAALRLTGLPEHLRGDEARLRQALGKVDSVLGWSTDGSSCVVRFADRRHADVAMQAQKVWGFLAEFVDDPVAKQEMLKAVCEPQKGVAQPVSEPIFVDDADAASGCTEDFESDIEPDGDEMRGTVTS